MEEHEEQCDFHALGGEAVGVVCAVAFEQSVGSHLTQVIAQLVKPVALGGQAEVDPECLVELAGTPAPDQGACVQQHFHEADHAGVVDFDTRILGGAHGDGQCESLEQREVSVHVQTLRLEGGKTVGDLEKLLAHGGQMIEAFPQTEVREVVGADLIAQEGRELLVLLDEPVLPIGAEGVMAVLELLEGGMQLTFEPPGQAAAYASTPLLPEEQVG
jgi:hypothetical protein